MAENQDFTPSDNTITLPIWRNRILPKLRKQVFPNSKIRDLTLLAYFFWQDNRIETELPNLECAFLSAYKCFGWLPGAIVTNHTTKAMSAFSQKYDIRIIDEPYLHSTSGVKALCIESIARMHTRFETDYVLTLQTDGMPVNPGIENFIGKYDYVGAPWARHMSYLDLYPYPKYGVGNGGFSLRSKRICKAASAAYGKLDWLPFVYELFCDDVFYCKVMPFFSKKWQRAYRYAPIDIAAKFSIESITPYISTPPVGFHNQGFNEYVNRFGTPFSDLLE